MTLPSAAENCPTCGAAVKVVGSTTQHYEPIASAADLEKARALGNKLMTDARLRQNDPIDTILQALAEVRRETAEKCAGIAEGYYNNVHVNADRRGYKSDFCNWCKESCDSNGVCSCCGNANNEGIAQAIRERFLK